MITPAQLLAAADVVEPAARASLATLHDRQGLGEAQFLADELDRLDAFARQRPEHAPAVVWALLDALAAADAGVEAEFGTKRGRVLDAVFTEVRRMYANVSQA